MGQQRVHQPSMYKCDLTDMQGRRHEVLAIGKITLVEVPRAPEIKQLAEHFPEVASEGRQALNRPHGTVKVLLRMASQPLHFKKEVELGKHRLNKSMFSPGWVLTGSKPEVTETRMKDTPEETGTDTQHDRAKSISLESVGNQEHTLRCSFRNSKNGDDECEGIASSSRHSHSEPP